VSFRGLVADSIAATDAVIDARTIPDVTMPNRKGFVSDPRPDVLLR